LPQCPLSIPLIVLGAVASQKILAIENMTPQFWPMPIRHHDWTDQDTTWYTAVRLGPGDIVFDGDPAPPRKGAQQRPPFGSLLCLAAGDCRGNPTGIAIRLVIVALWNRADHYIFILSFVLSSFFFFFSSLNLSRRRWDVCHTSTHSVALVRI